MTPSLGSWEAPSLSSFSLSTIFIFTCALSCCSLTSLMMSFGMEKPLPPLNVLGSACIWVRAKALETSKADTLREWEKILGRYPIPTRLPSQMTTKTILASEQEPSVWNKARMAPYSRNVSYDKTLQLNVLWLQAAHHVLMT